MTIIKKETKEPADALIQIKVPDSYKNAFVQECLDKNWSIKEAVKFGMDEWLKASNPVLARKLGLIK